MTTKQNRRRHAAPWRRLASAVVALAILVAACGSDEGDMEGMDHGGGDGSTIDVEMKDIAFAPTTVTVEAGVPVTFRFENVGKVDHEAIIGSNEAQAAHEAEMGADGDDVDGMPDGEMDHEGMSRDDAITVAPGETGELTYTFSRSDVGFIIGCHEPGHYEAGMKIDVDVR